MRVQSGRRSRGRNRKGPSPLSRSYESNGPDVKIRGTASHIADKYTQLARDAHASGDTIAAENYHQHAEHYLRIIAAAQAQMQTSERQDNPERDRQQSGEDNNPGTDAVATANGHGNGRSEESAEASADATSDDQARGGDQDGGDNQNGPRRRRRRSPRNVEAADDQGDAVAGQSTNGGTPYPADQPQPEIDEPA